MSYLQSAYRLHHILPPRFESYIMVISQNVITCQLACRGYFWILRFSLPSRTHRLLSCVIEQQRTTFHFTHSYNWSKVIVKKHNLFLLFDNGYEAQRKVNIIHQIKEKQKVIKMSLAKCFTKLHLVSHEEVFNLPQSFFRQKK